MQKDLAEGVKNYITSNLDASKDQTEVNFNIGGEITGKANIISTVTSALIQSVNEGASQLTTKFDPASLENRTDKIAQFQFSNQIYTTATGSNLIAGSRSANIVIMSKEGTTDTVKDLKGDCPISFQIPVLKTLVTNKRKLFKCVYYDEATNSYLKDGVTYKGFKEEGDYYVIDCCATHLTTFNAQLESSTDIRDKISSNY